MKKIVKILLLICLSPSLFGADTLNVGVNVAPPFVEKIESGYGGVSIDLFNKLVRDTSYVINYKEFETTHDLIESIKLGNTDVGVGSVTITPERYGDVNFTQPYYRSSISLAYDPDEAYGAWDSIVSFFNVQLLYGIFLLLLYLWCAGMIFWLVERKSNDKFKDGGIMEGAYFSFMILSTVGFGDVSTVTKTGKALTMFFGTVCLIVSSFFIANIASSFTMNKMDSEITVSNLNKKKVGTLRDCTSSMFLDNRSVRYIGFNTVEEGLNAIKSGELDVFVYDTPILQYMIENLNLSGSVIMSNDTYEPQFYGFPYRKDSEIDERVNPLILEHTNSSEWMNTLYQYNLEQ